MERRRRIGTARRPTTKKRQQPPIVPTSKLEQYLRAYELEAESNGHCGSALSPKSPSSAESTALALPSTSSKKQPRVAWGRAQENSNRSFEPPGGDYNFVGDGDNYFDEYGRDNLERLRRHRSFAILAHRAQPVERDAELWSLNRAMHDRRHAASALANEVTRSMADMDALLDELENAPAVGTAAKPPVPRAANTRTKSPIKAMPDGTSMRVSPNSRQPLRDLSKGQSGAGAGAGGSPSSGSPRAAQIVAATTVRSQQQLPLHDHSFDHNEYRAQQQSFASSKSRYGEGSSSAESSPPVHFYYDATSRHAGFSRVPPPFSSETARQYFPNGIMHESSSTRAEGRYDYMPAAEASFTATRSPSRGCRRNLPPKFKPPQEMGGATIVMNDRAPQQQQQQQQHLSSSFEAPLRQRNDWMPSAFHDPQTPLEVSADLRSAGFGGGGGGGSLRRSSYTNSAQAGMESNGMTRNENHSSATSHSESTYGYPHRGAAAAHPMHAHDADPPPPLPQWDNASRSLHSDQNRSSFRPPADPEGHAAPEASAGADAIAVAAEAAGRNFMASATRAFYGDPRRFQALLVLTAALDRLQEEFGPQMSFNQPNDLLVAAAAAYDDVRSRAAVLFADYSKLLRSFQQFLPPQTLPLRRPSPPLPVQSTMMTSNPFPAARAVGAAAVPLHSNVLPTPSNESRGRPHSRDDYGSAGGGRGRSKDNRGNGLVVTLLSGSRGSSPAPQAIRGTGQTSNPSAVPHSGGGGSGGMSSVYRHGRSSSPGMAKVQHHGDEGRSGNAARAPMCPPNNVISRLSSPNHSPTRSVATSHPGSRPGSPGNNSIVAGYPPGLWRAPTTNGITGELTTDTGEAITGGSDVHNGGLTGSTSGATAGCGAHVGGRGGGGPFHSHTTAAGAETTTTTAATPGASAGAPSHQSRSHRTPSPGLRGSSVRTSPSPSLTALAREAAHQLGNYTVSPLPSSTPSGAPRNGLMVQPPPQRHSRSRSPSTPVTAPSANVPDVQSPVARSPSISRSTVSHRVPPSPQPVHQNSSPALETTHSALHSAGSTGAAPSERLHERPSAFESYQRQQQPSACEHNSNSSAAAAESLNVPRTMYKPQRGGGGGSGAAENQRAAVFADLREAEVLLSQSLDAPSSLQTAASTPKHISCKKDASNLTVQPPSQRSENHVRNKPLSLLELAEEDENTWRPTPPQVPQSSLSSSSSSLHAGLHGSESVRDASPDTATTVVATHQTSLLAGTPPQKTSTLAARGAGMRTSSRSSWSVMFDVLLVDLNLATFDAVACKSFVAAATEAFGTEDTSGLGSNDGMWDCRRHGRVEVISVQAGSIQVGARLRGLPSAERARVAAARASKSTMHGGGNSDNPTLVSALKQAGLGRARLSKMEVVAEEEGEENEEGSGSRLGNGNGNHGEGATTPVAAAQSTPSQCAPRTAYVMNGPAVTPLSSAFVVQRLTPCSAIAPPTPTLPQHHTSCSSSLRGDASDVADSNSIRHGNLGEELERLGLPVEASAASASAGAGARTANASCAPNNGKGGDANSKSSSYNAAPESSSSSSSSSSRGNRFARAAEAMPLTARKPPRAPPALSREGIESVERRRRTSLLAVNQLLDKANGGVGTGASTGGTGDTVGVKAPFAVPGAAPAPAATAHAPSASSHSEPRSSSPLVERVLEATAEATAAAGTAATVAAEKPLWEGQRAQYMRRSGLQDDLDLSSIAGSLNSSDV